MNFWQGKRVIITGGAGFLGSHLVAQLRGAGADPIVFRSYHVDLTKADEVEALFEASGHIDILFHLAAVVGGIGANMKSPRDFYALNTLMNTLIVESAVRHGIGKFVAVGSVCAYPKYCPPPFVEENLMSGEPEETNAPYGHSKRGLLVHLRAARKQDGFKGIYLLPTNLYGPGDNFHPSTSHVIPALIRKIDDAQHAEQDCLTVWGTGSASRDFLFVEDAATALILAAERYDGDRPVNLGSGQEISIAALAELLCHIMGFTGRIEYDGSKPDGQPRRVLNISRAWESFGWKASTSLQDGLTRTVEAWRSLSINS